MKSSSANEQTPTEIIFDRQILIDACHMCISIHVMVGKSEGKRPLGMSWPRWQI
jgi:hypothetical protein